MARFKIFQERIKQRYTSHWDLDYMTHAQLEAALRAGERPTGQEPMNRQNRANSAARHPWRRRLRRWFTGDDG